jgi:hypothetical protein
MPSIQEQLPIRLDNAQSSTTSAPSAATDGIKIPTQYRKRAKEVRVHLHVKKASASGTRSYRIKLYGYISGIYSMTEKTAQEHDALTAVVSSGFWSAIGETGTRSDSADFNESWLFSAAASFERVATQIITNGGGGSETITTVIGFEEV